MNNILPILHSDQRFYFEWSKGHKVSLKIIEEITTC